MNNFNNYMMFSKIKNFFPLFALIVLVTFTSCSDDEAPVEDEFFNFTVDGESIVGEKADQIDPPNDNSIGLFFFGSRDPFRSVNIDVDDPDAMGEYTCLNDQVYSIRYSFNFSDSAITAYDDSDDACVSTINITRNDSYIEGSFSSTLTETSSSDPETISISGTFKVRK